MNPVNHAWLSCYVFLVEYSRLKIGQYFGHGRNIRFIVELTYDAKMGFASSQEDP